MKILQLIPRLGYTGASGQLMTLAGGLASEFDVQIATLAGNTSTDPGIANGCQARHIAIHVLSALARFDPVCCRRLHRLIGGFQPDIIHAWGALASACALAASVTTSARVVMGHALAPWRGPGFFKRRLLGRAARIIARGTAEADRYRHAGIPASKVAIVPPSASPSSDHHPKNGWSSGLGRFVLCAGAMERHRGFRNAIWAFDILRFLFPDLALVLAGDGPDRAELEWFAHRIQVKGHVHFLGPRADLPRLLKEADMIWIPSNADCGLHMAVEALSAGKPLIASNVPSLREVIEDGQTGFLVPPGNIPLLARRSRELLRNPQLAARLGAQAQSYAARFSVPAFIQRMAGVYQEILEK